MKRYKLFLLLPVLLLSACATAPQTAPELLEPAGLRMQTATVQSETIYTTEVFNGAPVPYVEALSFPENIKLGQFHVLPGDTVQAGQLLVSADSESLQTKYDALDAQIRDIETTGYYSDEQLTLDISIAQKELSALEEGTTAHAVKQIGIRQLQTKLAQQQELRYLQVIRLSGQLQALAKELEKTQLTAPFDGIVVYIAATKPGGTLRSTSIAVCLADPSQLEIRTDYIDEQTLSSAQRIYTRVGTQEYALSAIPMDSEAYIQMILSEQLPPLSFAFAGAHDVRPGDYTPVILESSPIENALTIPTNALFRDAAGAYVYRIDNGTQVRQAVTVGAATDIKVQILTGLREGDVVYVQP